MKHASQGIVALGVRRPVLITVLNLLIVLFGLAALTQVDVRELPDVDQPIVTVRAEYQGASPTTMDAEITAKLEGAVARVSGVKSIESSSEENNMRMRVEFASSVDLNQAANDVREALSRVQRDLPDDIDQLLVIKTDSDARAIVQMVASSETLSKAALTERVERDLIPMFLSIDGVADVQLDGAQPQVMRVRLDPAKMAAYRITLPTVLAALRTANLDVPAGNYESDNQELLVRANASAVLPAQIDELVVTGEIKMRQIAASYYDAQTPESYSLLNGRSVVSLGIVRQAGANTIDIAEQVKARVARVSQTFQDVKLTITQNDAVFITSALSEVLLTLLFAIGVVLVVIGLFLGQLRAVLIPAVTMPVALIGTVAAIWLAGFSVNLLTLLALVLATGLIVDDAIVVLENIQRRRAQGLPAISAAVLGTQQVFFAVIATTVTLVSVFLPIAFLPGNTGRLFSEFGFVLSISVIISTFVAVSICPMLAAKLLANDEVNSTPAWMTGLTQFGHQMAEVYYLSLDGLLKHRYIFLCLALAMAGAGYYGFTQLNQELLPPEDRGRVVILATGPDGASLTYTGAQAQQVEAVLAPYVESGQITDVYTIVGRWDKNRVYVAASLPPWEGRDFTQQALAKEINAKLAGIPGSSIRIMPESSLNIRGGGAGLKVAILGSDYDELGNIATTFSQQLTDQIPSVDEARVQYDTSQPELSFSIDRQRASDLGVDLNDLSQTLRVLVDEFRLLDLSIGDKATPLMVSATNTAIRNPQDILNLFVVNAQGNLVPLGEMVSVRERGVAAELDRHAQRRAVEIDIGVPPGTSLDKTTEQIRTLGANALPTGVDLIFLGEAAQLQDSNHEVTLTFVLALLIVFLVLAAQFESITSAAIVIFTVPFGLAAAVFALLLSGQSLNLYSQVGLVMLIGLMTKNAILIIEIMDQLRDAGRTVEEAIYEGVRLRIRPVSMTVLSTVLGGVPLVLTSGAGAEAREAIGWVIVGGLGMSTLFTLYLAPLGYALLAPLSPPRAASGLALDKALAQADTIEDKGGAL